MLAPSFTVVFIYDVLIIFDQEVAYFWNAKSSGAALLFFSNEWINLVYYITLFAENVSFSSDRVSSLHLVRIDQGSS